MKPAGWNGAARELGGSKFELEGAFRSYQELRLGTRGMVGNSAEVPNPSGCFKRFAPFCTL